MINRHLWNSERLVDIGVGISMNGLCGEDRFIQIYDSVMLTYKMGDLTNQIHSPLFIFNILRWIDKLRLLDFLAFDLMESIELSQKSRIDIVVAEMAMEE